MTWLGGVRCHADGVGHRLAIAINEFDRHVKAHRPDRRYRSAELADLEKITRDVGVFQTVVGVGGEDADLYTGQHAADIGGSIDALGDRKQLSTDCKSDRVLWPGSRSKNCVPVPNFTEIPVTDSRSPSPTTSSCTPPVASSSKNAAKLMTLPEVEANTAVEPLIG